MKAEVGDRIVVASGRLHQPSRDGEILQIGEGGAGPCLVRLFFPGPTLTSSLSAATCPAVATSLLRTRTRLAD